MAHKVYATFSEDGTIEELKPLSWEQRKRLPKSSFVFPEKAPGPGSYPIPDRKRAANAIVRARQFGSPEVQKKVIAKVCRKFPDLPTCKKRKKK